MKIEEHQKWMYDADPFQAKKIVEERQAKAAQKSQRASTLSVADTKVHQSSSRTSSDHPEVIMATSLRESIEDAIKQVSLSFFIVESTHKGQSVRE